MYEIVTQIVTPAGAGQVSVMYFAESANISDARDAVGLFWLGAASSISNTCTFTVPSEGRVLDPETGVMTAAWADGSPNVIPGSNIVAAGPDAAQGLVRWTTGQVVNGRFVKGRTFVPGLANASYQAGNVVPAVVADLFDASTHLVGGASGLVIWHRPSDAGPGSTHAVTSSSVWNEAAVLRRRRR